LEKEEKGGMGMNLWHPIYIIIPISCQSRVIFAERIYDGRSEWYHHEKSEWYRHEKSEWYRHEDRSGIVMKIGMIPSWEVRMILSCQNNIVIEEARVAGYRKSQIIEPPRRMVQSLISLGFFTKYWLVLTSYQNWKAHRMLIFSYTIKSQFEASRFGK